MFVRVRQRRPSRRRYARMVQLPLETRQAITDLAQRMGSAELTEQHRDELSPTGEPAGMTLRLGLMHQRLERVAREQLEKLTEHAAECLSRVGFPWQVAFLCSTSRYTMRAHSPASHRPPRKSGRECLPQ